MEYKTSVNLAGVELKNPVMTASGTFGSAGEYGEFYDLGELGAVVTKGVANVQSDPAYRRDKKRHAERHRASEPGIGRIFGAGSAEDPPL